MDIAHLPGKKRGTIAVGMSGGVDSSVAALLLQQQGFDVIGIFMKNWEDDAADPAYRVANNGCSWEQDFADMRAVCQQLDIPYLTFNFVKEYKKQVFGNFLQELQRGRTPNPDILCNQEIKFHLFLQRALALPDVSGVATGHYARITDGALYRPKDTEKDQTYFLYRIKKESLSAIHFPLSEYTKEEVREIAHEAGLATSQKKDSTGICFIGDIDYPTFVKQYVAAQSGDIIDLSGTVIGQHDGLHLYTIGQRKGINIGGSGPYYVVAKKQDTHTLIVTNDSAHPALQSTTCVVEDVHLLEDVDFPLRCMVQIRYRQQEQSARITQLSDGNLRVDFDTPQRAVTPGQSAVFYLDNRVLGGGIISEKNHETTE